MVLRIGASAIQATLVHNNSAANRFVNQATERLATGRRINSGSDDPAGLIAAEQLRSDLIDISAGSRINTALRGQNRIEQSGLQASGAVLQELRGLVVQAAGDTSSQGERDAIQLQVDSSLDALELIASSRGTSLPSELVNLRSGGSANLADGNAAEAAEVIDAELASNTAARMAAGVYEKYTLDVDRRLAEAQAVAAASSLSAIEDADYAQESSNLVVGGILAEASIRTIALSQRIQRSQATAIFDHLF